MLQAWFRSVSRSYLNTNEVYCEFFSHVLSSRELAHFASAFRGGLSLGYIIKKTMVEREKISFPYSNSSTSFSRSSTRVLK